MIEKVNIKDFIAGSLRSQYQYESFTPSFIYKEWLIDDPSLNTKLSYADRCIGELNAFSQMVPDIDFFISMHVTKEATKSSRIEGTKTNIQEALEEEEDIDPEKRDDWTEVRNYIDAINFSIEQLERLPLSSRLIRETHGILMRGVRGERKTPGEYRKSQNWIGPSLK